MATSSKSAPNGSLGLDLLLDRLEAVAGSRAAWWVALSLMLLGLVAPLLLVDVPPLCDYPNHLARAMFLAFGETDPVTSRMFASSWQIAPNLALDLILPPLLHLMPPLVAGKVLLGLAALLPATGAIAINRACFGRRSLWALGVGLVVYNVPFLLGFINFQLGIGVALWGAAAWIWLAPRRIILAVVLGVGFGLVAFFSHLFSFAFYGLLIACVEAATIYRRGFADASGRRFAAFRIGAVTLALATPALLYLISPLASTGGSVFRNDWITKLKTLAVPIFSYSFIETYAILAALAGIFISLAITRRIRVAPFLYIALPLLFGAFLALPTGAKGVFFIDTRIPVMIGFIVFAATLPRVPRHAATGILVVLTVLFIARMTLISKVWLEGQRDVSEVRSALASVTPGSRVFAVGVPFPHDRPIAPFRALSHGYPGNFWHYAAFAYIDHRAFWSDAFTIRGQQPVVALPAYVRSSNPNLAPLPDFRALVGAESASPGADVRYLRGWSSEFDYILVMNADAAHGWERFLPKKLTFVSDKGFAVLFKVRHQ